MQINVEEKRKILQ